MEIVGEKISIDCIQHELTPWICKEIEKMEDLLKILRSDFKSHLETHENNKIIFKGKIYHKEKIAIIPILIDAVGEQTEEYFTRENCIKITDYLFTHFQLKNKLNRISNDHIKYHIWIPNQALLELNEIRKKSENTFNNAVSTQSGDSNKKDQDSVSTQTNKM